jgi:hypothetical protein
MAEAICQPRSFQSRSRSRRVFRSSWSWPRRDLPHMKVKPRNLKVSGSERRYRAGCPPLPIRQTAALCATGVVMAVAVATCKRASSNRASRFLVAAVIGVFVDRDRVRSVGETGRRLVWGIFEDRVLA